MEQALRAIEATGIIDEGGQLRLDKPLPATSKGRVKVILLFSNEADLLEQEWLRAAMNGGAFDVLSDPAEDIYSQADGKPFDVRG